MVVSNHLMFHFSNQHIDYTLATSLYGDWDVKYHSEQSGVVVNLQLNAHTVLYSSPSLIHLLLGLRDGQLLLLTVETAGTGVRAMQMRKLAVSSPPSTITTLHRRGQNVLVYLGSRVGSSLLLDLRERSEDEMHAEVREQERQEAERGREREERDRERQRLLHGDEEAAHPLPQQAKTEAEEEFDDIFGSSLSTDREREAQRREVRARAKEETSRQFELIVRDAMVGLAPTVDFVVNAEKKRAVELVAVSGQGQQGAITVQTAGVVPMEITKFALDQRCTGCWTVRAPERRGSRKAQKRKREDPPLDPFNPPFDTDLFISGVSSTTHLHTGEEITQVEPASSYLRNDVPSLLVANLCGYLAVIQIWYEGMRVVWRGERIVERGVEQLLSGGVGVGTGVRVTVAKACDPYVVLGFSDGDMRVVRIDEVERKEEKSEENEPFTVTVLSPSLSPLPPSDSIISSPITAMSLYRDPGLSGLFSPLSSAPLSATPHELSKSDSNAPMEEEKTAPPEEEEDELAMLLGGAEDAKKGMEAGSAGIEGSAVAAAVESIYVCVICRSHYLELYSLPSFTLLFRTPRFTAGRRTLTHLSGDEVTPSHVVADSDLPVVTDVALHLLSSLSSSLPVLCAYTAEHDVLIYRAFSYLSSTSPSTALRFSRFQHGVLTRPLIQRVGRGAVTSLPWLYGDRFIPFASFSGHMCLLLTGYHPLILTSHRGALSLHPFILRPPSDADEADKEVERDSFDTSTSSESRLSQLRDGLACCTPFHNSQCDAGCVFIDIAGYVNISELPLPASLPAFSASASAGAAAPVLYSRDSLDCLHLDRPLPVRVHPLLSTPRFLCYHSTTGSFAVVLSRPKPIQSMEEPTPRSLTMTEETYELLLLSSPSSAVPFSVIGRFDDFDAHECVLCMATVALNDRMFIAIGTGTQLGEETSVKGRILLLDAYAAASSVTATGLLKLRVFAQSEKGPVTCASQVGNLLAVGVGQRLMLYEFDGKTLVGRAFLDVQHCVVAVRSLKYYLLIADLFRTVLLAAWDPVTKQIIVLGRLSEGLELTSVDFILEQRHLTLVAADMAGNLQLMRWQPKVLPPPPPPPSQINGLSTLPLGAFFAGVYSQKGLQVKADFHSSTAVTKMERVRMRVKEAGKKGGVLGHLPLTALNRGKSGTGGSGSGGVTGLLPEVPLTARQLEQQAQQPFKLDVQTPPLSTPTVLPAVQQPLRSALLLSSIHGQFSLLQPLDELVYRRLHSLALQLHLQVPMAAALNARAYRGVSVRGGQSGE